MNDIMPKVVHVDTFTVSGLSVRTINSDEFNPEKAKLPELWGRFLSEGIVEKTPNRRLDSPVFGVYSGYDSDETGFYTVTLGVMTSPVITMPEFSAVTVKTGEYLVFVGRGNMPEAVVEAWKRVWHYFEEASAYKRTFITDFEAYNGADEIAIHIGIVR